MLYERYNRIQNRGEDNVITQVGTSISDIKEKEDVASFDCLHPEEI